MTPQRSEEGTRLPQQDVILGRLNVGSSGNIWEAMFRWLVPRHQAEVAATTWTKKTAARQKRRRNATGRGNRSPRTTQKENPSRCTEPVGGTDAGWLAEEVENLAPSIVAPGEPAIANHQTQHEVHNQVSRRRAMLLMQGTEVPEHRTGRNGDT